MSKFTANNTAKAGISGFGATESCIQGNELSSECTAAAGDLLVFPSYMDSIVNSSGTGTVVWVRLASQADYSGRSQYKKVYVDNKLTIEPGLFDALWTAGADTANYNVATVYYNEANPIA